MNNNDSRLATFFRSKGLYLILAGCVLTAALASWSAIDGMRTRLETQQPSISAEGGGNQWDVPVVNEQPDVEVTETLPGSSALPNVDSSALPSTEPAVELNEQDELAALQQPFFALPVAGEIANAYSGNELVYNATLADWRTHNGTDIYAVEGAAVAAAAAGTITKVYNDALWGTVIEQTSGELTLRYAGLNKDVAVKVGDTVDLGQTIGRVGLVPAEESIGPHIHFEVIGTTGYKNPVGLVG